MLVYIHEEQLSSQDMTNMTISSIIKKELKSLDKNVSVRTGKGSAFGWVYIYTTAPREIVKSRIELLKTQKLISLKYDQDDNGKRSDCLLIQRA